VGDEVPVTISNVITVDHPSSELLTWCKQNLKLKNPEYSKKQRMHFWVGNTPEYLYLYETRGGKLILPYGTLYQIRTMRCEEGLTGDGIHMAFPASEKID
jgi:hypothetical protein